MVMSGLLCVSATLWASVLAIELKVVISEDLYKAHQKNSKTHTPPELVFRLIL